jgi:hypothetical protein
MCVVFWVWVHVNSVEIFLKNLLEIYISKDNVIHLTSVTGVVATGHQSINLNLQLIYYNVM